MKRNGAEQPRETSSCGAGAGAGAGRERVQVGSGMRNACGSAGRVTGLVGSNGRLVGG